MQHSIEDKLKAEYSPDYLEVVNESGNHKVAPGSETHFKVLMVSSSFQGKASVIRHRMVNKTLAEELAGGVHALSLKLMTPQQWEAAGHKIESQSPPCASSGHV
jgi:BolA protein